MGLARSSVKLQHSQTVDGMQKLEVWPYLPRATHCLLRPTMLVAIPVPFEGQRQETESTRFQRRTTENEAAQTVRF